MKLNGVNKEIINAIIDKANQVCPNSLAMIAVYGSVATEDEYSKSDLDLVILISDDVGWQLGTGFILDDAKIGYDIYCTKWDRLEWEAQCNDTHISNLMDSQIVYVHDEEAVAKFETLRAKVKSTLSSEERFKKSAEALKNAKLSYAEANLSNTISKKRLEASRVISYLNDALMLFHGRYFHLGIKRTFQEMEEIQLPKYYIQRIRDIITSKSEKDILTLLTALIKSVEQYILIVPEKEKPSADNISGTYEEMFSNWRNKVEEAAIRKDTYASFMNLCSLQDVILDISGEVEIEELEILSEYDPNNLDKNVNLYDRTLEKYLENYKIAGMAPRHYTDVSEFVKDYLEK